MSYFSPLLNSRQSLKLHNYSTCIFIESINETTQIHIFPNYTRLGNDTQIPHLYTYISLLHRLIPFRPTFNPNSDPSSSSYPEFCKPTPHKRKNADGHANHQLEHQPIWHWLSDGVENVRYAESWQEPDLVVVGGTWSEGGWRTRTHKEVVVVSRVC